MTDTTLSPGAAAVPVPAQSPGQRPGQSPWQRAWKILRRDRPAMAAAVVLLLILVSALAAPLYASHVAGVDPFRSNLGGKIMVDGKRVPIMQPSTEGLGLGVTPIGRRGRENTCSAPTARAATSPPACSTAGATRC
ncbi:hypothetical protein [Methylobrevis pamukkalensis]|uniref:Oligopeptide transport permease C-like N-terminal domain-containing protein n=1 Tax=Methylobrevis pamukkalensis TaxID=1439726 RepID=A0A1E3H229_9HYPH|nr:hypothetical protein [Methylobrevis pamukkalensis]ODN70354.1 hypothetical protein A6302_02332 [Methylobrevis pamukkalensis]